MRTYLKTGTLGILNDQEDCTQALFGLSAIAFWNLCVGQPLLVIIMKVASEDLSKAISIRKGEVIGQGLKCVKKK